MTLPLSVFIIALNEADRIVHTIESVRALTDDIVVIDSGSTDGTQEVAQRAGARVMYHSWVGYGPQKRFGEEQCKHDWLLNLDADEVLSEELREEISRLFSEDVPTASAYFLTIAEILPGESMPSRGHRLKAVRLYDRRGGRYSDSTVHDRVQLLPDTPTGALKGLVWHRSSRSLTHSLDKINRYSSMQAEDLYIRGKLGGLLLPRLIIEMPAAFAKAYFARGYIWKGMPGFINAVLYGFSRFIRLAKLHEKRKSPK